MRSFRSISFKRRAHVKPGHVAPLLALLALFANQAALPLLHFAVDAASAPVASSMPPDHYHLGHEPDRQQPAADHHQTCHFCRLLGAALPPPSSLVIAIVSAPEAIAWPLVGTSIRPEDHFLSGHSPRAPPLVA
jgi:hypothetical protein